MRKIAFIACSKSKKGFPSKARKLYQGDLFKKALAYTEPKFDEVWILSAKYGLVHLDQVIEPYEKTLNNMPVQKRKEWAQMVKRQMHKVGLIDSDTEHFFFTGSKYHEHFEGNKPLLGKSLGFQLQWFTQQLAKQHKTLL